MIVWGISAYNHDAAISVVNAYTQRILFASQSERYSKIKNDKDLHSDLIRSALNYGLPDKVVYYENPWLKKARCLLCGQYSKVIEKSPLKRIRKELGNCGIFNYELKYIGHHLSHAGSAYMSPFKEATVLVIDAIGEFDVISIWKYKDNKLEKLKDFTYPNSLGLFYSAFTKYLGLKPNEEEYIMMGMSSYGKPIAKDFIKNEYFNNDFSLKYNLHRGIGNKKYQYADKDIASSVQSIMEEGVLYYAKIARELNNCSNLVYGGGCALNCCINPKLYDIFDNVWIFPNPGDSGSSLGAVLASEQLNIPISNMYLGYNIPRNYPIYDMIKELVDGRGIAPVASGKAEFGPRALGNRSILANPLILNINDRVNEIKKREKYRPFAPVILEEKLDEYFIRRKVKNTKYMQFTLECRDKEKFRSVTNVDGFSRVQTVSYNDNPNLYRLLKEFEFRTGCPMLLNTSLNIKGQPIVNNELDVYAFSKKYNIRVF